MTMQEATKPSSIPNQSDSRAQRALIGTVLGRHLVIPVQYRALATGKISLRTVSPSIATRQ